MSAPRRRPENGTRRMKSDIDKGSRSEHKKEPSISGRNNPNCLGTSCLDRTFPHQPWVHTILFVSIICVTYLFSSPTKSNTVVIARQDEIIEGKRFQNVVCPAYFIQEVQDLNNERCLLSNCGHVVFDGIVSDSSAHKLLEMGKKGFAQGGASGPISILDMHSGALSKGDDKYMNVYKAQPDLFEMAEFELYRKVIDDVRRAVADHFHVSPDHLYLTHPTMFQRIIDQGGKLHCGEYWHPHVDKETYPSFHFNSLLYLSDFNHDFQGGQFTFIDENGKINRTVEPRIGRVSAFTTGSENLHYVHRVTNGTRYVLQMGFSCDKSEEIANAGGHLD